MRHVNILVNDFLRFLGERNLERLTTLFAEKVDWYIPGDADRAPWLGRRECREQVRDFFSLLWSVTEPVSAVIDHIAIDGEQAVITGQFSTKMLATGRVVDSLFFIHMVVRDHQIIRYRLLEDSYAVSESLR